MSCLSASRRELLRAGALAAAAVPLLASCTTEPSAPPPPDPLAELADQARADAAAADAVAASVPELAAPAAELAKARGEHAIALQSEADRERPPKPSSSSSAPATSTPTPPADPASAKAGLVEALTAAEKRAAELVPTLPRHRAGLVGSVAAGCAGLREGLR